MSCDIFESRVPDHGRELLRHGEVDPDFGADLRQHVVEFHDLTVFGKCIIRACGYYVEFDELDKSAGLERSAGGLDVLKG